MYKREEDHYHKKWKYIKQCKDCVFDYLSKRACQIKLMQGSKSVGD